MAKPKTPLLSFGARGTIADSLTFQKRGRLTIARQKPIPTDPQTDLQLAQRQVYRDAVADWNALTPEEKEAYRGVCPGLTPYQCYMKSALVNVTPAPPQEEYIEEQTDSTSDILIKGVNAPTCGHRLFILSRKVSKLGFFLKRSGDPTNNLTFTIRKVSDKSLIVGKLWGAAADVPTDLTYLEVEFDTPTLVNEEVRILIEHPGAHPDDFVISRLQMSDVKANEFWTRGSIEAPVDMETWDFAYRYKYYEV